MPYPVPGGPVEGGAAEGAGRGETSHHQGRPAVGPHRRHEAARAGEGDSTTRGGSRFFLFVFLIVCFTSYFVFSIAVLPHSPGVVYYHLLLRRETRIPGVAPRYPHCLTTWVRISVLKT